ncbi:MAG: tetratricopeptide repeat protein [Pseudomonadota bacterium]
MVIRIRPILLAMLFGLALSGPATADDRGIDDPGGSSLGGEIDVSGVGGVDGVTPLDGYFAQLREAAGPLEARAIEALIWEVWTEGPSDTAALLFGRAEAAVADDKQDLAIDLLDGLIRLAPGFAEAWHTRATVHYMRGDFDAAIADIGVTLNLEPRHFGALQGLGAIFHQIGEEKQALEAYEKALTLNPHLDGVAEAIRLLEVKVRGRRI